MMSQPDEIPALSQSFQVDIPSYVNEPQAPAGPSIEEPASDSKSRLEDDFNFQIVVFEVFLCLQQMTQRSQHLSKRLRIGSFGFSGMASMFLELLSRQCLHYRGRRQKRVILRAVLLKIPSICQKSRRATFGPSCASYIRCEFR